jgi:hypothetical protein
MLITWHHYLKVNAHFAGKAVCLINIKLLYSTFTDIARGELNS